MAGKTAITRKKGKRKPRVVVPTVRHTLYLREDLNDSFLILTHLKFTDLTKRINSLVADDVEKHKAEIEAFKNRKK